MDNLETVLQCLNDFQRTKEKNIVPELDELLIHIAKTGRTEFQWHLLKPLIAYKLERVLDELFENNASTNAYISEPTSKSKDVFPDSQKLISNLNHFTGTPFTIQRICELLTQPKKYYKTTDKFLRGVEKNIMVVSTIQPDGSLITRSVPSLLTNGDLSPAKTDTAPASPNLNPSNNSPLNTITQDHASTPKTTPAVTTEEKAGPQSNDVNSVETNTSINITQDSENKKDELSAIAKDVQSSESDKVVSNEDGNAVDTPVKDNFENGLENGTSETKVDATEKVDVLANNEPPTDERPTSEEESMEES